MTATQSQRHVHHDAPTGHVHNAVADNHLNDIGLSLRLAHRVYWRSRAVRIECLMRVVFRSWSLAVHILVRERLEALCEELKSQTGNGPVTLATTRKHQLVEAAVTQLLWSRDRAERETVGQLRLALRELRQEEEELQPERKRLLPHTWKRFRAEEINELAMERNIPVRGPDGQAKVKDALIRDLLRWCERQPEVPPMCQSTRQSGRHRAEQIHRDADGIRRERTSS